MRMKTEGVTNKQLMNQMLTLKLQQKRHTRQSRQEIRDFRRQVITELQKKRDTHASSQIDPAELRNLNQSTYACITDRELSVKSAQNLSDFSDEEAIMLNEDNRSWTKFVKEQGDWWIRLYKSRKTTTTAKRYKPYITKFLKEFPLNSKKLYNQQNINRYILR